MGIFDHLADHFILSVNFYLGCFCWISIVIYQYVFNGKHRLVIWLLLLATFNILIFSASISTFGAVHYLYKENDVIVFSFGLNPLFLLILIVYCVINRNLLRRLYYGSDKERIEKINAGVDFYYNKFNSYDSEELHSVFKSYKDYPNEAQLALKKIHQEKGLDLIEF
jgi:hypothetical protein